MKQCRFFPIFLLSAFLFVQCTWAQPKQHVIRATSRKVSINDGGYFKKNSWTISPKARPDIYTAERTRKTKWVTFYTDIDSISVKVKPGTRYNFVILFNGTDSCYTQIASAIPPAVKLNERIETHDTIPFILSAHNAIAVKAVLNNVDTVTLHFDLSGYNISLLRSIIAAKTHLFSNQPDQKRMNKVTKLQIGTLVLTDPDIYTTEVTARDMDGRIGWNIFDDKILEINYDLGLLIIHSKLPKITHGYIKSGLNFERSFGYIKGTFKIADKKYTGDFFMDTGSEQALILDSTWVSSNGFPNNLKQIKTTTLTDPRGKKYETKTVLAPNFNLDAFALTNVPALILGSKNPAGFAINFLGNDVLKRFNMILDLKTDHIYLKPDKLMSVAYHDNL